MIQNMNLGERGVGVGVGGVGGGGGGGGGGMGGIQGQHQGTGYYQSHSTMMGG